MVLGEDGPFDILQRLRDFIYSNFEEDHWIYRGFHCWYCLSFWLSLFFLMTPEFVAQWFTSAELARRLFDWDRSGGR